MHFSIHAAISVHRNIPLLFVTRNKMASLAGEDCLLGDFIIRTSCPSLQAASFRNRFQFDHHVTLPSQCY